jgi:hypothetical protein
MSLANEIDRLHDLTEAVQALRPEVQHEFTHGNFAGLESGPMRTAHDALQVLIGQACRDYLAKAEGA